MKTPEQIQEAREAYERGRAYHVKKEYDLAIKEYSEAIRLDSTDTSAYRGRGLVYEMQKKYALVIKDYTEASRLDTDEALSLLKSNIYAYKEDYDHAIKDFSEAIRLDQTNALPYKYRGDIYCEKKEYDLAIKDYTETIRLTPTNAWTYMLRGWVYNTKKEYDLAIKDYSEAIRLEPTDSFICDYSYQSRGNIYFEKKEYEMAIKDFTEIIRLCPNEDLYFRMRGNVYFQKGEYDSAIRDYTEVIRHNPDSSWSYYKRSIAYMAKEEYDLAGKDIKKIFELDLFFNRRDAITGKCSFCGLPPALTPGFIDIANGKSICGKCINKAEIMETIKPDSETLFNEISERYKKYLSSWNENIFMNELCGISNVFYHGSARWLTDLTIEELRIKAREYEKPNPPEPVIINNIPIHKNQSAELLEGEIFKKHVERDVEVSNQGRVKYSDCILEQYDPQNNGYLFVDIKSTEKTVSEKVYRLVAETWLEKPDLKGLPNDYKGLRYNTVHHISNNGYDNRTENLMWVTEWQHAMIHPRIDINKFEFGELSNLFYSYVDINITQDDYQRIINIAKRMYELENVENESPHYLWYKNIIETMEDLIRKNGGNVEGSFIKMPEKKQKTKAVKESTDETIVDESTDEALDAWVDDFFAPSEEKTRLIIRKSIESLLDK